MGWHMAVLNFNLKRNDVNNVEKTTILINFHIS